MNNNAKNYLDKQLQTSELSVGDTLSKTIEIWKKDIPMFVLFGFVFMVISGTGSMIPLVGAVAVSLLVTPALYLGSYYFSHKVKHNQEREFGDFFKAFNEAGNIIITNLLLSLLYIALLIPCALLFFIIHGSDIYDLFLNAGTIEEIANPNFIAMMITLMIIAIVYAFSTIFFMYSIHFLGFFKLEPVDAIKYSFRYAKKHFLVLIAISISLAFLAMLGFFLFIIGIILTFPLALIGSYVSFSEMTDFDNFSEDGSSENISDMLVEL